MCCGCGVCRTRSSRASTSGLHRGQAQQVDAPAVGVQHPEAVTADSSDFVAFGQMAECVHHQTADGIELLVGELTVEELVEAVDRGERLDDEITAGQRFDVAVF